MGIKRYTFIRTVNQVLLEEDIGIFVGSDLCKEAFVYDRPGNLYISDSIPYSISMALGIAMTTKNRVFLFCNDAYVLNNLSEMAHVAVSKCSNIFIIVHRSGMYLNKKGLPTIFDGLSNPHGLFFNMGFKVHDYSRSLSNKTNHVKELREVWKGVLGPLVVLLTFAAGAKSLPEISLSNKQSIHRLKEFMCRKN